MNKDIEIPDWIGKQNVPEDKETSLELVKVYADLIEVPYHVIDITLEDEEFIEVICDAVNILNASIKELTLPDVNIWVGFPRTPIGNLNAALAHRVWLLKRVSEENDA